MIAGGGFGGFYAARALERLLPAHSAKVTLVNGANFMLYTPLLPGAAGATLDPRHVVVPLRSQLRHTDLVIGEVTGGDPTQRTLGVRRIDGELLQLDYDQLIVALGSVSRTLPIPGLAEHATGLKSLSDATALRNRVLSCMDIAETLQDPARRAEYLGFVFVGAGYAGVEGLAELQDFAAQAIELYPRCRADGMRWMLVEAKDRIMQEVPKGLSEFAARELRARGIAIRTETTVKEITERDATLSDGERIPARTVVWTAGVSRARRSASSACRSIGADAWWWIARCAWTATRVCGRSATARRSPIPREQGSRAHQPHSTRSARAGWRLGMCSQRSAMVGCAPSVTAAKESSPSLAAPRPSRSRSACAGAGDRRGSSPVPITCC